MHGFAALWDAVACSVAALQRMGATLARSSGVRHCRLVRITRSWRSVPAPCTGRTLSEVRLPPPSPETPVEHAMSSEETPQEKDIKPASRTPDSRGRSFLPHVPPAVSASPANDNKLPSAQTSQLSPHAKTEQAPLGGTDQSMKPDSQYTSSQATAGNLNLPEQSEAGQGNSSHHGEMTYKENEDQKYEDQKYEEEKYKEEKYKEEKYKEEKYKEEKHKEDQEYKEKEFKPDLSKPPTRTKEDPAAVPINRPDFACAVTEQDEDTKSDGSGDLQFRKKDFSKSRTQSFQSVLSSASLKSLKQQFTVPNHPQLHRNPSTVSQGHTKNFQSFIQAPVLSSVTNLRTADIEIGQRLPFDHRNPYQDKALDADSTSLLADAASLNPTDSQPENVESTEAEDIYKEETTLQQQKLTLNALKKLSLSLAPIIRSDEDDDEGSSRQLTTKSLNGSRQESRVDLKDMKSKPLPKATDKRPKPYQPAEVDLSSFSSLTRQSKHMGEPLEPQPTVREQQPQQKESTREQFAPRPPNQRSADSDATIIQNPHPDTQKPNTQPAPDPRPKSPPQAAKSPNIPQKMEAFSPMKPRTFARNTMQINTINAMSSLPNESKKPSSVKMPDKKLQQINGFRSPMYVPAVLRKTTEENMEYSHGDSEGYFEPRNSLDNHGESSSTSVKSFDSSYSVESVGSPAQKMAAPYTLNRRQYEYILRAAPTRKHWQRDESVFACGNKTCHKKFNFFERRHHCRKCGGIFCKEHTSHFLYINHLAQFTTGGRGTLSRVCDSCIQEYNEFMKHEFGVTLHAPVSRESLPERASKIDYRKEILVAKMNASESEDKKVGEQLVGSVPANWSWSSF